MENFKLKLILAILSGIVFSFIFIILAFVLPPAEKEKMIKDPKNKLEYVSKSMRER